MDPRTEIKAGIEAFLRKADTYRTEHAAESDSESEADESQDESQDGERSEESSDDEDLAYLPYTQQYAIMAARQGLLTEDTYKAVCQAVGELLSGMNTHKDTLKILNIFFDAAREALAYEEKHGIEVDMSMFIRKM
jgi:hypothetical protein